MEPRRMTEQELLDSFETALTDDHIFVCYQAKVNHTTGRMIGAEALMRWRDPVYGLQYPSDFIPVLEKNDLIDRADLHVFDCVCRFQRQCLDSKITPVPISFNVSRYDIWHNSYVDDLERIRQKYDIPVSLLHVEITETSAIGGMELVSQVLDKLHRLGYIVEMDDFGSGYSSLNVLKDLEVDAIKLDMRFLSGDVGGRGGTIISAMVQMTKWLNTPMIAEGVETVEQADYMKSIGCYYVQGYLYSKPVTGDEFLQMLQKNHHEPIKPAINLITTMNAGNFWDPNSMETLIFNHYVGAAAFFSYQDGKAEMLRVNKKYLEEIGMNLTEQEMLDTDPFCGFDLSEKKRYEKALERAIRTDDEVTCETWRMVCSEMCGADKICIRSFIRKVGQAGEQYLFYVRIQNVTAEKKQYLLLHDSEQRFRYASEHANVYAWEYFFETKQMHPCFRCMRDLGLPAVLENYPDSAIEMGVFPPEYAALYRDWLHQLENGRESIEGVIPLTVGRVPFHVRYTTVFDENGKPLKAFGSATLVVKENTDPVDPNLRD